MDGEAIAGEFTFELLHQLQVAFCTAGCALATLQYLDAQL